MKSVLLLVVMAIAVNLSCAHLPSHATTWDAKYVSDQKMVTMSTSGVHDEISLFHVRLLPDATPVNSGHRQELTDPAKFFNGQTVSTQIVIHLPSAPTSAWPELITLFQWHEAVNGAAKRPPFSLKVIGSKFYIVVFDDAAYGRVGQAGLGPVVKAIDWQPDRWYRFRFTIRFSPDQGHLTLEIADGATVTDALAAAGTMLVDQDAPIGYREATSYYFKFGPYTTLPFSSEIDVDYAVVDRPQLQNLK